MLVERLNLAPKPSVRSKFESVLAQARNENFEPTLVVGSLDTIAEPLEYLSACVLWHQEGKPLPFYCELLGDAQRIRDVFAHIQRPVNWQDRTETLFAGLRHAKKLAEGKQNPYLIGFIAILKSTSSDPVATCFQQKDFPEGLTVAICSHYPGTFKK